MAYWLFLPTLHIPFLQPPPQIPACDSSSAEDPFLTARGSDHDKVGTTRSGSQSGVNNREGFQRLCRALQEGAQMARATVVGQLTDNSPGPWTLLWTPQPSGSRRWSLCRKDSTLSMATVSPTEPIPLTQMLWGFTASPWDTVPNRCSEIALFGFFCSCEYDSLTYVFWKNHFASMWNNVLGSQGNQRWGQEVAAFENRRSQVQRKPNTFLFTDKHYF